MGDLRDVFNPPDTDDAYSAGGQVVFHHRVEGDAYDRYQALAGGTVKVGDGTAAPVDSRRRPYWWWQHTANRDIAIPSGVWTPIPWNNPVTDPDSMSPGLQGIATTIAAGSNAAVLPQSTINVADTSGFPSSGYLVITGPPGANIDTVVQYTGKTATSFTGCNTGLGTGISTGTLATGQVVTAANVEFGDSASADGYYLGADVIQLSFGSIPTTNYCAIRGRAVDGGFNLVGGTNMQPGLNIAKASGGQAMQFCFQPAAGSSTGRIEAFQNSGSVKQVIYDGIQSPSFMHFLLTPQ